VVYFTEVKLLGDPVEIVVVKWEIELELYMETWFEDYAHMETWFQDYKLFSKKQTKITKFYQNKI